MSLRQNTIIAGLLAALLHPAAAAQTDATRLLVEQATYWQERGDSQRAADAWQKLLRADANNLDALYGMGIVELSGERPARAQQYATRLRALGASARAGLLEQEIAIRSGGGAQPLTRAREHSQAGEVEQAIADYRTAFGGKEPQGPLAVEYYQTLGSTEAGWDEARQGLERLVKQDANNVQARFALAQLLTFRESSRRDGIRQLAQLAGDPRVGKAATASWRAAVLWLGDPPPVSDTPLLQTYLKANPDDTEVRGQLEGIRSQQERTRRAAQSPTAVATAAGFKALDAGDLVTAESEFTTLLERQPNNSDALGGLGIIRLRQQNFTAARELLERASKQGSSARWRQPLNSATYWSLINQARTASGTGNYDNARRLLEQAVKIDSKEVTGQTALADVMAQTGQLDAAEKAYRRLLASHGNNPDVIQGMVGVLAQNNKADEALQLIERLSPAQQNQLGVVGRLRASRAVGLARAASQRGDIAAARAALEDALVFDPNDPWTRLELARLYMRMGAEREARGIVDGLLVSNPGMPDALFASALMAAEAQDWPVALETLNHIPPQNRTPEMAALQRRVWVHTQSNLASQLAQQGRQREALAVLAQTEGYAEDDVELLGAIALAYVDTGDVSRSLAMIRNLMGRSAKPEPGLLLQYAAILSKTNQDVELAGVLRQLQGEPMSPSEQQSYQDLRYVYIVRQADALRTQGNLPAAYDVLAPVLAERPGDALAVGALARMYADAGDSNQALALFKQLLQHKPNDVPTLLGAANMATQANDYRFAESSIDTALVIEPRNPEVLAAAARLYRAQGKSSKAAEYLKAAIDAGGQGQVSAQALAAGGAPGNPFAGMATTGRPGPLPGLPTPHHAAQGQYAGAYPSYGGAQPYAAAQPYIPPPVTGGAPAAGGYGAPAPAGYGAASVGVSPTPYSGATNAPGIYGGSAPMANTWAPSQAAQPYIPSPATPAAPAGYFANSTTPANWVNAPAANPGPAFVPPTAANRRPPTLQDELQQIRQERSPTFTAGAYMSAREGESGMSELTNIQAPLEARLPIGDGKFAVRVTPVTLDAGNVGGDYNTSSRFGGGPAASLQQLAGAVGSAGSQSETGVGAAVAYVGKNLEVDIGTTPLGFQQTNIVGGVKIGGSIGANSAVTYGVNLSRRAVTDSLLSFAGAHDRRTGQKWGGVTATGGRFDLGVNDDAWGVYGHAGWHSLKGHNVVSNSRFEGGFGVYTKLIRGRDHELTAGLNFTGISYDKNLRHFTYGHGGYFSPQRFFSVSVPVSWAQRRDRLSYSIGGALGVQSFKENAARYFPGNDSMQLQAQLATTSAVGQALTGTDNSAIYEGQSKTGLGYNLSAALEYQVTPQLYMGGALGIDNARDYREWTGGVYLRYAMEPAVSGTSMPLPVSPYRSPYGR